MAFSTKLSDALHMLVFISTERDRDLSSAAIARSLASNPSSVRQLMSRLRRSGLITSVTGHARPELALPSGEISMLDVYRAVEGDKPLLHLDTHINPACGVGVNAQLVIGERFSEVQAAAEAAMKAISLEDIIRQYRKRIAHDVIVP